MIIKEIAQYNHIIQKSYRDILFIESLLIQKVQNIAITESLYKEQVGGVAVRAIVSFDHINNQEVTDYELSYRVTGESADLTAFTSVKVPASSVDSDGKIRFIINTISSTRRSIKSMIKSDRCKIF